MKLSIIIPCYNMELYLQECVDSLLNQRLNPDEYEIIIVNDESKDNTLKIAIDYSKQNDHIKVILLFIHESCHRDFKLIISIPSKPAGMSPVHFDPFLVG